MILGDIDYGTWKDGSVIYKDKNGYYIVNIKKMAKNIKNI